MIGNNFGNIQYFNPAQIPGLKLWLDATDPSANGVLPSNGSAVSSWTDKSGNGNTVIQASGAAQPVFTTNILNGKPIIRFDGSDDFMQKTSASSLGTQITCFIVCTFTSIVVNDTAFDYSTNAGTNTGCNFFEQTSMLTCGFFDGALHQAISSPIIGPYTAVMYVYNDGSNGFIFSNGVQMATVASGNISGSPNVYTIGSLFGGIVGYFLNGDIGEVLFYNGNLSTANKLLLSRYLGGKWGITVA